MAGFGVGSSVFVYGFCVFSGMNHVFLDQDSIIAAFQSELYISIGFLLFSFDSLTAHNAEVYVGMGS